MSNPDVAQLDGLSGGSADRHIYVANEQAALAVGIDSVQTAMTLAKPAFANADIIIVGTETMRVVSGGGTAEITVDRAVMGTTAAAHLAAAIAYAACNYEDIVVTPLDTADSDESSWCLLALTQAGLEAAIGGAALSLGNKTHDTTLSFWRRFTVPADTPVQNKSDLKLRLTGTESRTNV